MPDEPPPVGYVLVPAGSFTMGSPDGELGRRGDETQHEVVLTRSFYLKATEVTRGEWRDRMGTDPSEFVACEGDACPVESVNWWETLAYCNALSRREGLDECYVLSGCDADVLPGEGLECAEVTFLGLDCPGYRLPTEAEWEYAARAGAPTALYSGDVTYMGCEPLDAALDGIGWYCGNSEKDAWFGPYPTGVKVPNGWGLYDMSGNVREWVWDWHAAYPDSATVDPTGAATGTYRVDRGGSADEESEYCRAATRGYDRPEDHWAYLGFRICRSIP